MNTVRHYSQDTSILQIIKTSRNSIVLLDFSLINNSETVRESHASITCSQYFTRNVVNKSRDTIKYERA